LIGTGFAARAGCFFTLGIWHFGPSQRPDTGRRPSIAQSKALDINYPAD
jgi:hypothetical protein